MLTIGYAYPNILMSENYNAPGSPYWCMKAFAFLMLPAGHPFWQTHAAPLPTLDAVRPLPGAEMLAQRVNGMAVLYPAAARISHPFPQMEEKYAKFAYCSRYAFSAARSQRTLEEAAPDSVLSFRYLGHIWVKGRPESWSMTANGLRAVWAPLPGVQVVTEISLCAEGHIRRHTITSTLACEAFDAGFALPADCPGTAHSCTEHTARAAGVGADAEHKSPISEKLYPDDTICRHSRHNRAGNQGNLCLQSSGRAVQDVHISDCAFTSVCAGIRIGLKSIGEISQVVISNCTIRNIWREGIKIECTEGGSITDVLAENITMHNVSRTVTDSAAVQNHHQLRVFCAKLQVFHSFPPRSGSLLQLQTEIAALVPAPQRLCPVPEQLWVPGNPFPSFYGMSQSSSSVSLCSFIISTNTTAF